MNRSWIGNNLNEVEKKLIYIEILIFISKQSEKKKFDTGVKFLRGIPDFEL